MRSVAHTSRIETPPAIKNQPHSQRWLYNTTSTPSGHAASVHGIGGAGAERRGGDAARRRSRSCEPLSTLRHILRHG